MTAGAETRIRPDMVRLGASLFSRRLTFGPTGNLGVRHADRIDVTAVYRARPATRAVVHLHKLRSRHAAPAAAGRAAAAGATR
jgi:hypothetical protein